MLKRSVARCLWVVWGLIFACGPAGGLFFFQSRAENLLAATGRIPVGGPAPATLDSLRLAADSLARAADSLGILVDSLSRITVPGSKKTSLPKAAVRKKEKSGPKNLWSGSFGLGLTLNSGNSDQKTLVTDLRFERKGKKIRFFSQNTVTTVRSTTGGSTDKGAFMNKFEINHSRRLFYFGTLDMRYNRQAGLNLRVAPGAGAGVALISKRKSRLNLNLGANPITEYQRSKPRRTHGYYLGSQDFRIDLNHRTRIEERIKYNVRIDRVEQYLLTVSLSLTNKLTRRFDLKMNVESEYNSRPPARDPPYKRQDWMFYTAVNYELW